MDPLATCHDEPNPTEADCEQQLRVAQPMPRTESDEFGVPRLSPASLLRSDDPSLARQPRARVASPEKHHHASYNSQIEFQPGKRFASSSHAVVKEPLELRLTPSILRSLLPPWEDRQVLCQVVGLNAGDRKRAFLEGRVHSYKLMSETLGNSIHRREVHFRLSLTQPSSVPTSKHFLPEHFQKNVCPSFSFRGA
jgi:hypothetical protein